MTDTNIRFVLPPIVIESFLVIYMQGCLPSYLALFFSKVFFLHESQDCQSDSCSLREVTEMYS